MGDRAAVVLKKEWGEGENARVEYSPSIYLHWDGYRVMELVEQAAGRMRRGDLQYSAARLVGVMHEEIEGNLSLGIDNVRLKEDGTLDTYRENPGDAGLIVVDVEDLSYTLYSYSGEQRGHVVDPERVPE